MILTSFALTVAPLYAVELNDPVLRDSETFVSGAARATVAAGGDERIYCLDLPERSASHARACLVYEEWQRVFDLAAEDASDRISVQARDRAIALASWYSR